MSTFTVQVNCAEAPVTRYVDLYSRWGDTSNYNYDIYYQIDAGSAVYWGTIDTTTCSWFSSLIAVPNGSTLYVYAVTTSTLEQVYITADLSSTCPANTASYCVYSTVITADGNVAITVYVNGSGNPQYCT